jgi:hypothetical protein
MQKDVNVCRFGDEANVFPNPDLAIDNPGINVMPLSIVRRVSSMILLSFPIPSILIEAI